MLRRSEHRQYQVRAEIESQSFSFVFSPFVRLLVYVSPPGCVYQNHCFSLYAPAAYKSHQISGSLKTWWLLRQILRARMRLRREFYQFLVSLSCSWSSLLCHRFIILHLFWFLLQPCSILLCLSPPPAPRFTPLCPALFHTYAWILITQQSVGHKHVSLWICSSEQLWVPTSRSSLVQVLQRESFTDLWQTEHRLSQIVCFISFPPLTPSVYNLTDWRSDFQLDRL